MPAETTTAIRTCPLCEATCGLELTLEGDRIVKVRGDADDVFSEGFICPKGASIAELHDDPDRLRAPLLRRPDGGFDEVSWDEAFAFIDERFREVEAEHGRAGARRLPRQPGRPLARRAALRPRAAEGARHAQRLLREHRRPVAQAAVGRR